MLPGYAPRSVMAGLQGMHIIEFDRHCQTVFQNYTIEYSLTNRLSESFFFIARIDQDGGRTLKQSANLKKLLQS